MISTSTNNVMDPERTTSIHILLIEDDPLDAGLVREYVDTVAPGRFQVTCATRVDEALMAISTKKFDVILLDPTLPDSSGSLGFVRLAKAAPLVPIIVLTGVESDALEKDLMALGARDYLRKGNFDGRHLASVLSNWVSLARRVRNKSSPQSPVFDAS